MSKYKLPAHIEQALTGVPGDVDKVPLDVEAVRQWLTSQHHHQYTLNRVVWFAATHARNFATEAKIDIVRLALARGAEPRRIFAIETTLQGELAHSADALCVVSSQAAQSSPRLIDLLLRWCTDVNDNRALRTYKAQDGQEGIFSYSPLAYALFNNPPPFRKRHLAVAIALLSGGMSLDRAIVPMTMDADERLHEAGQAEPIEWLLNEKERRDPSLADDATFTAIKALVRQVRAAGSYRDYVIEQRRTYALVRHLALRDRATTRDGVLRFLARTGERGLFRRVMSYLPPPPLPPPHVVYTIRVRNVATGEQTFFKIKSTTVLAKVFRAYAKVVGGREGHPYTTQWAFSLPASPDVLIEGYQTGNDLGLADGSMIDATLYEEHPVGLREQAAAAAAAADAARQYLAHLRADERFLGAEDAEEAVAHAAARGARGLDWDAEEAVAHAAACGLD